METPLLLPLLPLLLLLRFHSFLLFLGQPSSSVRDIKVTTFCRIISEFSLEYRTTRERVLTLKRKRAAHRERTKTRGKMITEVTLLLSLLLLTELQLLSEGGQQQDLLSFLFHHKFLSLLSPSLPLFLPLRRRSFQGRCLSTTSSPRSPWPQRRSLVRRRSMRT